MKKLRILSKSANLYIIFIFVFLLSIFYTNYKEFKSEYSIDEKSFLLVVTDYKIDGNKISLELVGKEKLVSTYYFKSDKEKNKFIKSIDIGDKLYIKGNLNEPKRNTVPNAFNYKKYLYNKRIYYTLSIENYKLVEKNKNIFYKIKIIFYERLNKIDNNEYLYAFILGEKSYINSIVYESYSKNGITHLFALSGLHTGILSMFILFLLKKMKSKIFKYIITFMFLLLICFITGFSASILRSTFLFLLVGLNKIYNLKIKTVDLLILTAIILLLINPFLIYDLSFILSFTITYFILLNTSFYGKNYFLSLLKVSFISFLASIPIIIDNFYQINIFSIINNLFFIPFVSYIVYPLSLFSFIFPFLNNILLFLINIMESVSIFLSKIDFLLFYFSKMNYIWIIVYYIFIILYSFDKRKTYLFIITLILCFNYYYPLLDKNNYIYFTDVGQGDSALIIKNNKSILIDTGGLISYEKEERNNNYSIMLDTLIPFYKSLGIKKINYLFLSHGDYDHMGEAINLVNNFKVEKVIFNCGQYNDLEKELIKVLDKKKIPYYSCIKELNIDDNKLYFLNNKDYGDENDNSSVIYTELNNYKFLFMGDAGVEVEEDLTKKYNLKDIDVLKVGHHGSNTSSSKIFIDEIKPKYSIISVGKNNRYGHPNSNVLENLEDSKVHRTDQDGSIMFQINKDKLKIEICTP